MMQKSIFSKMRAVAMSVVAVAALSACSVAEQEAATNVAPRSNASTQATSLSMINWPLYIGKDTIANFEKEFGVKMTYENFESNDDLSARMTKPDFAFDLVVPSSSYARGHIQKGALVKLDKSKLPNISNLDPVLMSKLRQVDPNGEYLIPWGWGYTTVGINKTRVQEVLKDTPIPENTWELVFNPVYTQKLKECGILMMESATEMMPTALHYIGRPAYSMNKEDHKLAVEMLNKVRGDILGFADGVMEDLAGRRACVVVGWAGDINLAGKLIKDIGEKDEVVATIPSKGGLLFIDTIAIHKGSKQVDTAHDFINYFLRPDVAAGVTNSTNNMTGNSKAVTYVVDEISQNKTIVLAPEDLAKMVPPSSLDAASIESMEKLYGGFKEQEVSEAAPVVAAPTANANGANKPAAAVPAKK